MSAAEANQIPMIEMRGVACVSMRDRHAVIARNVNWTVQSGEFWVIAGLQGSGKTDFIMMAAGLMAPHSGSYKFLGQKMPIFEEARLSHRLRLGLVFDGGQLFNHLTVRENVALPLRYHKNLNPDDANEQVFALLEAMELADFADTTPGAIARNWHRRAGLARALIMQPELLLVDNPLGALDPRHTAWWLTFLTQLSRGEILPQHKPVTIVVTVTDLRPWGTRGQRFAFLRDRQFLELGSWSEVLNAEDALVREMAAPTHRDD